MVRGPIQEDAITYFPGHLKELTFLPTTQCKGVPVCKRCGSIYDLLGDPFGFVSLLFPVRRVIILIGFMHPIINWEIVVIQ